MKKIVVWLSIIVLLVTMTGCDQSTSSKQEQMPTSEKAGYVEREALKPVLEDGEFIFKDTVNPKGQLEYMTMLDTEDITNNKFNCYTLVDGTFQKTSLTWLEKASRELNIYPFEYCHGQNGVDYVLYIKSDADEADEEEGNRFYGLIRESDTKGDYVDITPPYWMETIEDGSGHAIKNLQVTKDGVLCYRMDYTGEIVFYDTDKAKEITYGDFETYHDFIVKENTLYFITSDNSEIQVQHLGGEKANSITLSSSSDNQMFQVSDNGNVYLLDHQGIKEFKKGGTMWEIIMDAKKCCISEPSYIAERFLLVSDMKNSYYIHFRSEIEEKGDLYASYTYEEDATLASEICVNSSTSVINNQKKILKIYSMWDNTTLRQAISDYRREHPEVEIDYTVAVQDASAVTQADIVRTVNTDILAGNGADIFLMDDLPLASYIKKGVLMDMSDILSQIASKDGLLPNIEESYRYDGKVYCMPMRIYVPIFAMNSDITEQLKTVEDIANYCKKTDVKLMEPHTYEELTNMFLYTYYNELFTEDGSLDQEKLSSFIDNLSIIAKQTDAKAQGEYKSNIGESGIKGANDRMREILSGSASLLLVEDITSSITFHGDIFNLQVNNYCCKGEYAPINNTFVSNGLVGINKATKEPEIAKEFVSFLFSEKIQTLHLNDGFPVNEKALTTWITTPEDEDSTIGLSACGYSGKEVEVEINAISVEDKKKGINQIYTLKRPVYDDYIGMDMILQGTVEYLKGEKTLEEAVSKVVEKVNLYLKE
ncbi:MAG: ABC transporter substrate-binding protein [Clostridiales bacterium]|nr:ABC transporter substrate-binding protein [Clostridiales bacterium]